VPAEGGAAFPLTPHHEALSRLFMPPRKTCGVPAHSTRHRSGEEAISGDRAAGVGAAFSEGLDWSLPCRLDSTGLKLRDTRQ